MYRVPPASSTRQRLRLALGCCLALAVGAVGVQLARSQWAQHLRSLRTRELDFLPQVAQRIQNFRRVKMEGDRKVWEVAAREAQYQEEDQQIVVDAPDVSFYLRGNQGVVRLEGKQGKIKLDGREMDRVDLEGAIELHFRDYVVRSDGGFYERAKDSIVSPGSVTVTGDGLSLRGDRMTLEMESQKVRFDGSVQTVLEHKGEAADAGRS